MAEEARERTPLEESLHVFGFASLDDITIPLLKRTFKTKCVHAHPDRGGSSDQFDQLLTAYTVLYKVLRHATPCMDDLIALDPHAVFEARDKQFMEELHQVVGELMEQMDHLEIDERNRVFNEAFEKAAKEDTSDRFTAYTLPSQQKGYGTWMSADQEQPESESKHERESMSVPQEEFETPSAFHAAFASRARVAHPPSTTLTLTLDAMTKWHRSGTNVFGQELVSTENPAQPRREFTTNGREGGADLITVYEEMPTLLQEIPEEIVNEWESVPFKEPTVMGRFETCLKDREIVYRSELDRDLIAIAEYESRQQDMERRRIEELRQTFRTTASSAWALKD